jgi:hypothetical protein
MKDEGMFCEFRVRDALDKCWHDWFEGMTVTRTETGETVISGYVADQAALHGLLNRIRDLNLELISVRQLPKEGPS